MPDAFKGARIAAAFTDKVDERRILWEMGQHLSNISLPKKFIIMPELPEMGSGKIDFRQVTEMVHASLENE